MKQLNAERLNDTMEERIKHYEQYREQFGRLRGSFEDIVGLIHFQGRGATAIKGFYHGQIDVIDAWYRLIDHQTAFLTGVSGTLADFDLGGKTIVDLPFLSEDLAQGEKQADEMVSDQQQTLEQIFSDIEDIVPLSPFSKERFDQQMGDLHQKRTETIDAVNDVDDSLTKEYQYVIPERHFLMALIDQLLGATAQGGEVSTIHFDANAYHNSEVYKNIEEAEANSATYLANKQEQAHARELKDRSWNEVIWDGTKTFTGEMTGYYDSIRASKGVDPVTGVAYTAGQRVAYAGLAAAGFIPIVGWAGRAIKGGKAANTSLDIYKAANAFSSFKNVEMGIYGLASANGVSEYIIGKDILGNKLNAAQRSASLSAGFLGGTEKSINSFKEIGTMIYDDHMDRSSKTWDSWGGFGNAMTLGVPKGVYEGLNHNYDQMKTDPSWRNITNWLTMGGSKMVVDAVKPTDTLSAEHWLNSLGLASTLVGGGAYAQSVKQATPTIKPQTAVNPTTSTNTSPNSSVTGTQGVNNSSIDSKVVNSVGNKGTGNFANKNFASRDILESHYEKHAVKNNEFHGAYSNADEYMQGARDVMSSGTKVGYQYKGETRTGYVKFMGNSRKGEAKFEIVGTNANGDVTTYHVKRGEDLWKLLNNNKRDKTINPLE